jgi:hypothetical protein
MFEILIGSFFKCLLFIHGNQSMHEHNIIWNDQEAIFNKPKPLQTHSICNKMPKKLKCIILSVDFL